MRDLIVFSYISLKNAWNRLARPIYLIWQSAPWMSLSLLTTTLLNSILPLLAVQQASAVLRALEKQQSPMAGLCWWGFCLALDQILVPCAGCLQAALADKAVAKLNIDLMQKASQIVALDRLEQSECQNQLRILTTESHNRPVNLVVTLLWLVKALCFVIGAIGLLYQEIGWPSLVVIIAIGLQSAALVQLQQKLWMHALGRSSASRYLQYLLGLAVGPEAAKEVRLFGLGDYLIARYRKLFNLTYDQATQARWKAIRFPIFLTTPLIVLPILLRATIFQRWMPAQWDLGSLAVLLQLCIQTHQSSLNFCEAMGWLNGHLGFFQAYFEFVDQTESSPVGSQACVPMSRPGGWAICFKDIHFSYVAKQPVLTGLNLQISPGEKIAIVGPNGAGKSSLIKLLCGFYAAQAGEILINGLPIQHIDPIALRGEISAIFQSFMQYAFSVEENICMGNRPIDHAEIVKTLDALDAQDCYALPQGLQTVLGKPYGGHELSLGQWQKLALARSFLKPGAQCFLLDEPTAALDPVVENDLFTRFSALCGSRTTLLVTHRLGLLGVADRVLFVDQESGYPCAPHRELMQQQPAYRDFFGAQADRFHRLSGL